MGLGNSYQWRARTLCSNKHSHAQWAIRGLNYLSFFHFITLIFNNYSLLPSSGIRCLSDVLASPVSMGFSAAVHFPSYILSLQTTRRIPWVCARPSSSESHSLFGKSYCRNPVFVTCFLLLQPTPTRSSPSMGLCLRFCRLGESPPPPATAADLTNRLQANRFFQPGVTERFSSFTSFGEHTDTAAPVSITSGIRLLAQRRSWTTSRLMSIFSTYHVISSVSALCSYQANQLLTGPALLLT